MDWNGYLEDLAGPESPDKDTERVNSLLIPFIKRGDLVDTLNHQIAKYKKSKQIKKPAPVLKIPVYEEKCPAGFAEIRAHRNDRYNRMVRNAFKFEEKYQNSI